MSTEGPARPPLGSLVAVLAALGIGLLLGRGLLSERATPALGGPDSSSAAIPALPQARATAGGAGPVAGETISDPSVLVVVHSLTGRTAVVGEEIASMLGARFARFSDADQNVDIVPVDRDAKPLDALLADLSGEGVTTLFLGSPIWSEGASGPSKRFVEQFDLAGIRVVRFYTYVKRGGLATLEAHHDRIRARGATLDPPVYFQVPPTEPDDRLRATVQRAVFEHKSWWQGSWPDPPRGPCVAGSKAGDEGTCRVPAGWVWLGDAPGDWQRSHSDPPRRVFVPEFEIEQREVTAGQRRGCVEAGACAPPALARCSQVPPGDELPASCISYDDAVSYCAHRGMRLPTEAEWVRAARGSSWHAFPWGDSWADQQDVLEMNQRFPSVTRVSDRPQGELYRPRIGPACAIPSTNSWFGLCDQAGNLPEWVTTNEQHSYQRLKGFVWMYRDQDLGLVASRIVALRSAHHSYSGLRCASSISPK